MQTSSLQLLEDVERRVMSFFHPLIRQASFVRLFEDEEEDEIKYERLLRAELTSRCMDPQQYLEFSEARCTNFSRKTQKFRDWMFSGLEAEVKPNQYALEVLSYLAYETVAQIVDLALLVKQDMLTGFRDPLSQTLPNISHNINQSNSGVGQSGMKPDLASPLASPPTTPVTSQPSLMGITMVTQGASGKAKQKKKRKGHPYSLDIPREKAIQPGEIREAMRRYCAFIGPFASQMKHSSMLSPKFLKLCI
ncbi:transcription initiation protein SPT3 homolog [Dreissena polymorpha]|uniref:transcription initiation protein SPT3 homolog n=1 Tax=Dreissena polymorpha TaxID=45954 RepID=UPI002263E3F4|nr:transcription initiation protein SPT3 homolog [Dreissena polymorpha]